MEDFEDDEMAAAMGFSSFGGSKKRKYEPPSPTQGAASGSGANSQQLGVRPKKSNNEVEQKQENHGGDEAVVESTETTHHDSTNPKGKPKQPQSTGLASFLARAQTLPDKPPNTKPVVMPETQYEDNSPKVSFGGPEITQAELNALRKGVRNENGDIAYFLPSFVENPWEQLEKSRR